MPSFPLYRFFIQGTCFLTLAASLFAVSEKRALVTQSASGALESVADASGDRLVDFSHAGFLGGGVSLPVVQARILVTPTGGDDTAPIQKALDYVGALPADKQGVRGAVLLAPGSFRISTSLLLNHSGVVLRGSGEGPTGTILVACGTDRRSLLRLRGTASPAPTGGTSAVLSQRVPVGSTTLELEDASAFKKGDRILIKRAGSQSWITSVGMDKSPGPTPYYWRPGMVDLRWTRTLRSISKNTLVLDAPLTCSLDASTPVSVTLASDSASLSLVGVENLSCVSPAAADNPADEEHSWIAIEADYVRDSWLRNIRGSGFSGSLVNLGTETARFSVYDCHSLAPISELAGYRRHAFFAAGEQHLFVRCYSEDSRHDFAAGYGATGPTVFLDCKAVRSSSFSGSLGSWVTGLLFDNVSIDGGSLAFDNLESLDQGTGWNAANSVFWQCSASLVICRRPPGANNYAVGVWGQFLGDGTWHTVNGFASPESLFRAQLSTRLGSSSLKCLEPKQDWSDTPGALPTLASLKLLPQACDAPSSVGALAASLSESTPEESTAQPPLRAAASSSHAAPVAVAANPLSVKNGWLVVGDSLLCGSHKEVAWWRGQMNPQRATTVDLSLTRFAPGRYGQGLTDVLSEVADTMQAAHLAVLRHHYGLWYDRRRDDHEMTSRIDGTVWPPFYELPWARSGVGTTVNGLTRYDLTRYNPWYFKRLRDFASLAGERGLVLLNEMYFQHNILEAGAHWVDFPWRPANALQETGFQEPPLFVGGKRIFMADAFYAVNDPVRRPLHEAYIRQCLENLKGQSNVIHSLGDEFTGPLDFARFWASTAAAWQKDSGGSALFCLSAPKDVQDDLLADPDFQSLFSIIEFKYWWLSPKGLFAPKSAQNLAPRQSEREWKGGRPSAQTLAAMIWDYRSRFPRKAIITPFNDGDAWLSLAAGQSIPALPASCDPDFLKAVPLMAALGPRGFAKGTAWILAQSSTQAFVYLSEGGKGLLSLPGISGSCLIREVDLKTGHFSNPGISTSVPSVDAPEGKPAAFWISVSR